MAGAVIEMMSTRKMVLLVLALLLLQLTFFLIGGLVAPAPSYAQPHAMRYCYTGGNTDPVTKSTCQEVEDIYKDTENMDPEQLALVAHIPRANVEMIPWFQYLLGLLHVQLAYNKEHMYNPNATMLLDVKLYYSNNPDLHARADPKAWNLLATCEEERYLQCTFDHHDIDEDPEGFEYECEALHLFQLGSVPYKHYLVNIRLPIHRYGRAYNLFGHSKEFTVIAIRQTGGFTKVWMCLKSALTAIMAFPVVWFWRRIMQLDRKPLLLEKSIFALGVAMMFLNLPLELISIFFEAPWMLLFTDLRQGLFYAMLFSFWMIFVGEHMMDQQRRNRLSSYKCQLGSIFAGTMALLIFDLAERGVQLVNACSTIWTHHNLAMALLVLASIAGCVYFLLLLFMVIKVFRVISVKQRTVPRYGKKLGTVVRRFKFLMILTVGTAGLSVASYILSQSYDGHLDIGTESHGIEVNSAFFTGVYGLWNIYLFLVLSVYAPSHKDTLLMESDVSYNNREELTEFNVTSNSETTVVEQLHILEVTQQKDCQD